MLVLSAFAAALVTVVLFHSWFVVVPLAVALGILAVQIELLGHDIGHRQLLTGARTGDIAGHLLGNLSLGISYSYWIRKHNQHHAHPNHPSKDPDGNYPVLALTAAQVETRHPLLRPLVACQSILFWFWLPLQPVLMRIAGVRHIRAGHARFPRTELFLLALHAAWYGTLLWQFGGWELALTFFVIQESVMGVYNGLVFAPNHKGMAETGDTSTNFLHDQVATARNIRGNFIVDFMFGGLNYQAEHHLFPKLPRNKLRAARAAVRRACARAAVPYHETSFWGSYFELFRHLHRTSAPLRARFWRRLTTAFAF